MAHLEPPASSTDHATRRPGPMLLLLALMGIPVPLFSDMFMPALPTLQRDLGASTTEVQQVVSLFFLATAFMSLWHGAIADAFGRRRALFGALIVLVASSLTILAATRIEHVWLLRLVQGLAASAGIIVSRAIIRDLYADAAAQKMIGRTSMAQTLAAIFAPLLGGWLAVAYGWRAVLVGAGVLAAAMLALYARYLPETLPPHRRQPLNARALWRAYRAVLGSAAFMRLSVTHGLNWAAMFIYVAAAPQVVMTHFGRPSTDIYLIFATLMLALSAGFLLLPRLLARFGIAGTLRLAYAGFFVAACLNIGLAREVSPGLVHLVPIAAYAFAVALSMPMLIANGLQPFAENAGIASSCQMFIQFALMGIVAGAVVPFLWDSLLHLALGNAALTLVGMALLLWHGQATRRVLAAAQ